MPTETLTARRVAALAVDAGQVDFWDVVVPGLALRVGAGGTKTFFIRYRANGKQRRLTIGRHPHVTLADAREKARAKLGAAVEGEDPALERARRKKTDTSFRAMAEEVIAAKTPRWRPKTLKDVRRIVDVELMPLWGERSAGSITRRDVVLLVEKIERRAPAVAAYVARVVKILYNAALDREFEGVEHNPAHRFKAPEVSSRKRFLSREEIKAVWNGLESETLATRALLRFALLTGQRVGSVCSMRWADIDPADVWHISAVNFKGKRSHLVPLSKEAKAVLDEIRKQTGNGEFVFPGRTGAGRSSVNKAHQRVRDRIDIPSWTVHDFRRTFRTWSTRAERPKDKRDPAGCGVPPLIADAVLGHKELTLGARVYTGEAETYLLSEKRDALTEWGRFVFRAVNAGAR